MNEYQIVPYNFTIHVLGKPDEKRPLDNIDAAGLSAVEFISQAARAHLGEPRLEGPTDTTAMQVQQISKSDRVSAVTAGSAQRGVVSEVAHKGKTTRTKIREEDWTHTHLRNAFFVPPGSTVGVAMIERVGNTGVKSKLEKMLKESLKAKYPDLVFTMAPSMSAEAIEAWSKDARIKSIVLQHTHQTTGESTAKVGGLPFGQILTINAPRKHSWPPQLFGGKLDQDAQKKIMTEVVPQLPGVQGERAAEVAQQMMDDGWEVSLGLKKGSRQRLVKVSTTVSITMTFPASLDGVSTKRPTHEEFVQACQSALQEMSDDNMSVGQPKLCSPNSVPGTTSPGTMAARRGRRCGVFPSQTPLAVPRDQFLRSTSSVGRRKLRWGQLLLLLPGLLTGVAVWFAQPPLPQVSTSLLTVTAILTGFTFAMANTFWTKSIEARRNPRWAVDAQALDQIDDTRTHMIWTVAVGVLTVAILTMFALFGTTVISGWVGAVLQVLTRLGEALAGVLVLYLVTLVSAGLYFFNRAVAILKA